MSDSTTPRRRVRPTDRPAVRPTVPPRPPMPGPQQSSQQPSQVPQTPPLSEEELYLAMEADRNPPRHIEGYDPQTGHYAPRPPAPQRLSSPARSQRPIESRVVESRPLPAMSSAHPYGQPENVEPEEEFEDEETYDETYPEQDPQYLAVNEDAEDEDADEDDGDYDDDVIDVPLPPTAMPVEYTGWLDLGDVDEPELARKYRGWKIKCRRDYSLGFLEAAEALQDAARAAKRMQKLGKGRVRAEIRVSHIRTILSDVLVAWNYVDERGTMLPQPPHGLSQVRGDLLAATLNRAIMEVVPGKKRLRTSTPR